MPDEFQPHRLLIWLSRPMLVIVPAVVLTVVLVELSFGTRSNWRLMIDKTPLSTIQESLLVAAFYRGGDPDDQSWVSNSDQILTLSLFYTGDISADECVQRFSRRSYVSHLYQANGELTEMITTRYRQLVLLLREHPKLIEGGGDFETPADPTFTSCRLTVAGQNFAFSIRHSIRQKPEFPNWPDKQTIPCEH